VDFERKGNEIDRELTDEEKEELLERFRSNIKTTFEKNGLPLEKLFFVSALMVRYKKINNTCLFEFEKFKISLISNAPNEKKNALIVAFFARDKKSIQIQCDFLRERIKKVSFQSGIAGLIPIPGTLTAIDGSLISKEVCFYIKTLRLSKKSIEDFAKSFGIKYDDIERDVLSRNWFVHEIINLTAKQSSINTFEFFWSTVSASFKTILVDYAKKYFVSNTLEEASRIFTPVLGSAVGAFLSFITTFSALESIIENLEKTALDINEYCRQKRNNSAV